MNKKGFKKGDVIEIYDNPVEETKFKDNAELIEFIDYQYKGYNFDLEIWKIKFIRNDYVTEWLIKRNR